MTDPTSDPAPASDSADPESNSQSQNHGHLRNFLDFLANLSTLLNFLENPRLGYGRLLEFFLSRVMITYAGLLLIPGSIWISQTNRDLAWAGWGHYIWIPFAITGAFQWYGLKANIEAWPLSKIFRIVGACLGMFIWSWYTVKCYLIGEVTTLGSVFAFWSATLSTRVLVMACLNLPTPGSPTRSISASDFHYL